MGEVKIRLKPTITLPEDWYNALEEYRKRKGYTDFAELLRDLIRKEIIEKQKAEVAVA